MKKNILSLAVIVAALALAMPSQAQIKFGVKAGLNVNSFSVKNLPMAVDKKNRNGFFAGVTADFTLPIVGIGVDASLLYDNRCIGLGSMSRRSIKLSKDISSSILLQCAPSIPNS